MLAEAISVCDFETQTEMWGDANYYEIASLCSQ
jgi:hypothetical protein